MNRVVRMSTTNFTPEHSVHWSILGDQLMSDHFSLIVVVKGVQRSQWALNNWLLPGHPAFLCGGGGLQGVVNSAEHGARTIGPHDMFSRLCSRVVWILRHGQCVDEVSGDTD